MTRQQWYLVGLLQGFGLAIACVAVGVAIWAVVAT